MLLVSNSVVLLHYIYADVPSKWMTFMRLFIVYIYIYLVVCCLFFVLSFFVIFVYFSQAKDLEAIALAYLRCVEPEDAIFKFDGDHSLMCLNLSRAKYAFHMYGSQIRVQSNTYDHFIKYDQIKRMFLLPLPKGGKCNIALISKRAAFFLSLSRAQARV